jgi:hypothetical protein
MSRKKRRETPEWQWEEALIEAYHDLRWREVLEPLYEKFQRWKAGELDHDDMDHAIHETHKQTQEVYKFFIQRKALLIKFIQWDDEWFEAWAKDHPPPPGIQLAPPPPWASEEESR